MTKLSVFLSDIINNVSGIIRGRGLKSPPPPATRHKKFSGVQVLYRRFKPRFTAFSFPGQFAPRRTLANSLPGTFVPCLSVPLFVTFAYILTIWHLSWFMWYI